MLARFGVARLEGAHCYDLFARDEVLDALDEEPGTYFLTDFLARTFEHTVMRELGFDRPLKIREVGGPGLERALETLVATT